MGESWLFICASPSSNHPTSWRYNHLILHHYGLSNFIKPHTWFRLCCSTTAFNPLLLHSFLQHLYGAASVDVLLQKRSTRTGVCAQPEVPPDVVAEQTQRGRRPYLSRETFWTHVTAPATSCSWLAVAWSWHRLWMWCYEGLFSQSEVVNTAWEPVFSCGFPVPSAISSRSQELGTVAEKSGGKVWAVFRLTCVCLGCTFIHVGLILERACTCICVWEKSVWMVSMPLCFATHSLPESGTWCSFRWWQTAKSPVAEERGKRRKKIWNMNERERVKRGKVEDERGRSTKVPI